MVKHDLGEQAIDGHDRHLSRDRDAVLDDVHILALAIQLKVPVWSNDSDFEGVGVEWYTTAQLLKKLGITSRGGGGGC